MPFRQHSSQDSDEDSNPDISEPGEGEQAKFPVSDITKLTRLLILGGTNAVHLRPRSAGPPPADSGWSVIDKMVQDGRGEEVVEVLKDMSVRGRTSKQESLIFALAMCIRSQDSKTKKAAYEAISVICSIPTALFLLVSYVEAIGKMRQPPSTGWGRGLRRAVCRWYNRHDHDPVPLAMHVTKYASRHKWSHRDLFRLSHIKPVNAAVGFIVRYVIKGLDEAERFYLEDGYLDRGNLEKVHRYLKGVEEAKTCEDGNRTIELIREHRLVREHLRTEMLNSAEVWRVMLPDMPLTAMLRNLAKMTTLGLLSDVTNLNMVKTKLLNVEAMKMARIHPLKILIAHRTYARGKGEKGKLVWNPHPVILDTLDKAFYQSFSMVEPTGKKFLIALDISSSMGSAIPNSTISCREAAACMCMVTMKTEECCDVVGFHDKLIPLPEFMAKDKTLDDLVTYTQNLGFGATDCSKPMTHARKKGKDFDVFMILTDCETNFHMVSPWRALQRYRDKMNKPTAKLVVVAMTADSFSIARPDDVHMLDVAGFDPDLPEVIHDFLTGDFE